MLEYPLLTNHTVLICSSYWMNCGCSLGLPSTEWHMDTQRLVQTEARMDWLGTQWLSVDHRLKDFTL